MCEMNIEIGLCAQTINIIWGSLAYIFKNTFVINQRKKTLQCDILYIMHLNFIVEIWNDDLSDFQFSSHFNN